MSNEHQCYQLTCAEFWRVTDGDRIRTCRPFSSSPIGLLVYRLVCRAPSYCSASAATSSIVTKPYRLVILR
jgi:hypothetical protein